MFETLNGVLAKLPEDTILFPGHNYSSRGTQSTLREKKKRIVFSVFIVWTNFSRNSGFDRDAAPLFYFRPSHVGGGRGVGPVKYFSSYRLGPGAVPQRSPEQRRRRLVARAQNLSLLLSAQGRLISPVFVHNRGHEMLLLTPTGGAAGFRENMAKYAGLSEHRFEQMTGWVAVFLTGAQADVRVNALPKAFHVDSRLLGVEGYLCVVPTEEALASLPAILGKGFPDGVLSPETFEVFRVEGGVAKLSVDAPRDVSPMEIHLDDLVSKKKSCYVGQESVRRLQVLGPTVACAPLNWRAP